MEKDKGLFEDALKNNFILADLEQLLMIKIFEQIKVSTSK